MGTKGRGGILRDLFGSVTEKIVENAEIPVLAIPKESKFNGINTIIYATDFEKTDNKSINKLMNLFALFEAKIHFIHVCFGGAERRDKIRMAKLREHFRNIYKNIDVEYDLVESENIMKSFDDYVKNRPIDIISMTTRKRGAFAKFLEPSFTQKMLFHTNIPLLVFHS